jgi:hypothetical protein
MCSRELSDVVSHIYREHLPWLFRVDHTCFQCATPYAAAKDRALHNRHKPDHAVAAVTGLEDAWAETIQLFLDRLAEECGLPNREELLHFVQREGLYPEDRPGQPATAVEPAAFLYLIYSGTPERGPDLPADGLQVSPPNHVAALLHPRILAAVLMRTSPEFQGMVPSWMRAEWLSGVEGGRMPFSGCPECRRLCKGCSKHRDGDNSDGKK